MVKSAERVGARALRESDPQLLGRSRPVLGDGRARASAPAAQHLSGVWIGGQAPLIDAIAVVLNHQLLGVPVEANQEIAQGIQGDKPLGQTVVELLAGGRQVRHGGDRRQP